MTTHAPEEDHQKTAEQHQQGMVDIESSEEVVAEKKGSRGSTCGAICSLIISVPSLVGT
eukprot:CAMPEP_0178401216 /NCGR_PEP_ID=MMETSP0689_2-20121128/16187_1 /TAXON_ID=160604 /ORGANISM="Amphidinium massartii, Strain CS-259" /LENGTH=58 /DNA_ID=CAMNT_0020022029 /DNA_START=68 /DNA_END=244 /DNA_ORIENTATION=-